MSKEKDKFPLMKDGLGSPAIERLSKAVGRVWPEFDEAGFVQEAESGLNKLELKARVRHLIGVLDRYLPEDYRRSLEIVVRAAGRFPAGRSGDALAGFAAWPLVDWVSEHGLGHFDASLKALRKLTGLFSAEFAVRPFLIAEPERVLEHMHAWLDDPDEHVRRLVSEGTRPRLPWGRRLPRFVEDPTPVLELLGHLKDDPSEYVRRSVANSLNDISKDHPAVVVGVCRDWKKGASDHRKKVIRHALRTLVKQGNQGALKVLGYTTAPKVKAGLRLSRKSVKIGEDLLLEVTLSSQASRSQKLVVDYVVHHQRSGGKSTPKVFKLRTIDLKPGQSIRLKKKHSFIPRSVRRYYPGTHLVELLVSGQSLGRRSFTLTE